MYKTVLKENPEAGLLFSHQTQLSTGVNARCTVFSESLTVPPGTTVSKLIPPVCKECPDLQALASAVQAHRRSVDEDNEVLIRCSIGQVVGMDGETTDTMVAQNPVYLSRTVKCPLKSKLINLFINH